MIFSSNIGIARYGITAMNFDFVAILVLILDSTIHVYIDHILLNTFLFIFEMAFYIYIGLYYQINCL